MDVEGSAGVDRQRYVHAIFHGTQDGRNQVVHLHADGYRQRRRDRHRQRDNQSGAQRTPGRRCGAGSGGGGRRARRLGRHGQQGFRREHRGMEVDGSAGLERRRHLDAVFHGAENRRNHILQVHVDGDRRRWCDRLRRRDDHGSQRTPGRQCGAGPDGGRARAGGPGRQGQQGLRREHR